MFVDQVVLVSSVPLDPKNVATRAPSASYTHNPKALKASAKNAAPAAVDASLPCGFISLLDVAGGESFGVKSASFAFRDASIPLNCLTTCNNTVFSNESGELCVAGYHPIQSGIFLYATGKEKPVSRSFGHEGVQCLTASPCGRFLIGGFESGTLAVWLIQSGELVAVREGAHFQAVKVVKFSADGQLIATAGDDALVKVWRFAELGSKEALYTFSGHSQSITGLYFSLSSCGGVGRLVSCSLDASVRLYDLVDGQVLAEVKFPSALTSVVMDACELCLYAGSVDGSIYALEMCPLQQSLPTALKTHSGPVSCLAWSVEEGALISGGAEDGIVAFWDAQTRQLLKTLSIGKGNGITGLAIQMKADPLHNTLITTSYANLVPFKRLGSALSSTSSSVPLKAPISLEQKLGDGGDLAAKIQLQELLKENGELRQINAELCSLMK